MFKDQSVAAHAEYVIFFLHDRLLMAVGFVSVQSGFLQLVLNSNFGQMYIIVIEFVKVCVCACVCVRVCVVHLGGTASRNLEQNEC